MVEFNWLHLTDLHVGMDKSSYLWPNVEGEFFRDLREIHEEEKIGPLDLVLFTGDLVQRGSSEEFEKVNGLLERLWAEFKQMECKPKLLAVPGNHDLVRPESTRDNPNPAFDTLSHLWDLDHIQKAFWEKPNSPQRKVVNEAFKNYVEWWRDTPHKLEINPTGVLPGDFSATFTKKDEEGDEVRLGIVGLNSTFLQFKDGIEAGDLELEPRQFHMTCGGDGERWTEEHALCLLLTHHPPDWMIDHPKYGRYVKEEIHTPARRFALHLFGHTHESRLSSMAIGGDDARNRLQGSSLFGIEEDRIHGYSFGQLKVDKDQLNTDHGIAELRIWPRKLYKGSRKIRKDPDFPGIPETERGTEPILVNLLPQRPQDVSLPQINSGSEIITSYTSDDDRSYAVERGYLPAWLPAAPRQYLK